MLLLSSRSFILAEPDAALTAACGGGTDSVAAVLYKRSSCPWNAAFHCCLHEPKVMVAMILIVMLLISQVTYQSQDSLLGTSRSPAKVRAACLLSWGLGLACEPPNAHSVN